MQGVTYCANHERNWAIQIMFPGKPDSATCRKLSKELGLTFAPSAKAWIRRGRYVPSNITNYLAEIGAVKVDDIEREQISFGERMEEKQESAEARRERLEAAAEKASAEADRRFKTASTIAAAIPFGQPVLVGHHSERRDRNYRERIGNNMDKGCEASAKATELARRAESAGAPLKGYDDPAFLARRIKECKAEIARLERNKSRYGAELDNWQRYRDEAQSKLDYCQQCLADLGGVTYGPHNIAKGMKLHGEFGPCIVRRVNPTSVTVDNLNPAIVMLNPQKMEYGRIRAILAPAQATGD